MTTDQSIAVGLARARGCELAERLFCEHPGANDIFVKFTLDRFAKTFCLELLRRDFDDNDVKNALDALAKAFDARLSELDRSGFGTAGTA